MSWSVFEGDCRDILCRLLAGSVQTVVTSPPYFGLRDYGTGEWEGGSEGCDHRGPPAASATASTLKNDGRPIEKVGQNNYERQAGAVYRDLCDKCGATRVDRQMGLEPTPDEFVAALVEVFREVRRVLRDDGTVWLNLGDSYAANVSSLGRNDAGRNLTGGGGNREGSGNPGKQGTRPRADGCKAKDLLGIPWMVAFALRADGWYLRSDIIWSKPNPMPESVTDRPTKAHEYLFLLSKSARYFYDADAVREPHAAKTLTHRGSGGMGKVGQQDALGKVASGNFGDMGYVREVDPRGANKRTVWMVATQPYAGAHFATFPPKLIEPCILAGSSPKACGECGAPWRRIVERTSVRDKSALLTGGKMEALTATGYRNDALSTSNSHNGACTPTVRTVGWEPSCAHNDDTGRSVVLDPFAGSGTTGVVSGQLGRDFIGCELSPEYARLARERILVEGRPGARNHEPVRVHEDQLGLLG